MNPDADHPQLPNIKIHHPPSPRHSHHHHHSSSTPSSAATPTPTAGARHTLTIVTDLCLLLPSRLVWMMMETLMRLLSPLLIMTTSKMSNASKDLVRFALSTESRYTSRVEVLAEWSEECLCVLSIFSCHDVDEFVRLLLKSSNKDW
ncbi:unnamed protein product, partial [Thlaspi arvense]